MKICSKKDLISIEVDRSELEEIINGLNCSYNEDLLYDEILNRSLAKELKTALNKKTDEDIREIMPKCIDEKMTMMNRHDERYYHKDEVDREISKLKAQILEMGQRLYLGTEMIECFIVDMDANDRLSELVEGRGLNACAQTAKHYQELMRDIHSKMLEELKSDEHN
jgi:uncharacterized membrane protein YheB (UPF0754 family)